MKLLIVGTGPLPSEIEKYNQAGGLRTWMFMKLALKVFKPDEIKVILVSNSFFYHLPLSEKPRSQHFLGIETITITEKQAHMHFLDQYIHSAKCLISVNTQPSLIVSWSNPKIPWWADINGDPIIEGASKAKVFRNNEFIIKFNLALNEITAKADYFSTCSERQMYVLWGELLAYNRISYDTEDGRLVTYIPNPFFFDSKVIAPKHSSEKFKILSIGGYNTWVDVETLAQGLVLAMQQNPNLEFISTGGAIETQDNQTFRKFLEIIKKTPYLTRFIFKGYVPANKLPNLLRTADLGINCDKQNLESLIGARNRLNTYIAANLPVITSLTSEISQLIYNQQLGYTFAPGNPQSLAKAINQTIKDRKSLSSLAKKARDYFHHYYNEETNSDKLLAWLTKPHSTPKGLAKRLITLEKTDRLDKQFFIKILKKGYLNTIFNRY